MASKQPVPSRAALNALRGVILTTSCSVILLAEERRRRLQLARAAIENARKLHMVQTNRGPLALAESHASWGSRFVEVGEDVLSLASVPRPRTSTRRRGRSHLIGTQNESEVQDHDNGRAQLMSEADTTSEACRMLVNADALGSVFDTLHLQNIRLPPPKPHRYNGLEWRAPRILVQSKAPTASSLSLGTSTKPSHVAQKAKYMFMPDNPETPGCDSIESAHAYLEKHCPGGLANRPFYNDAIAVLERLLGDVEVPDANKPNVSERIKLATMIFQRLAAFGSPVSPRATRPLRTQSIRFLQLVSTSSPDRLTATLALLLPLTKDPLYLLLPFLEFLEHESNRKVALDVLRFLSRNDRSCSWARGMLVCQLLARQAKLQANFDKTKRVYRLLQDAGLFREIETPQSTEYKIRRLMIILALKHGDDSFAHTEFELLRDLDADTCRSDIRLQTHFITRDAIMGKWVEVCSDVEALGQILNTQSVDFQRLLTRTVDIFGQTHSGSELELLLRRLASGYRLSLKHRWIYAVLDHYASRRQKIENLFSWLQFCHSHGFQIDSACNQRFLAICRKFWSFSDKAIQSLEESLGGGARTGIQTASEMGTGELGREMASLASKGQWENVAEAYETAHRSGTDISMACLRLAVLAYTKCANPDIDRASNLIQSAYAKGQDVSEALTPLLLARLERGETPSSLINGALQMGVRIHDSAYNKAAQALSGRGDHEAAAAMCELAARENGNGELLYNEYNFANLVFAYTGSANYGALQSLLSGFTSDAQWWHGSRTCKETIKLAMKTTAMRSVAQPQNGTLHRQALDRLDDALLHSRKCRFTKDDRRAVSEAYVRLAAAAPPSTEADAKKNGRCSNKFGRLCRQQEATPSAEPVLVVATGSS
ncbi:uncharacterized protein MAM_05171 [Metarhizium album ARSEF 1941]|uniref:Uncharacterized protein n=1 Tax=Metarhizium album (strain ARSEF 1941) TaxID=1081103 RepID=A0A0B2WUB2_METAS|nr:uncharacterized protein MAM_05171 [Metarhizium album ARSEF 1941]KHN97062.1 hypothetical protein MAM_05171 [Metarhizium album ARSEF 1941]